MVGSSSELGLAGSADNASDREQFMRDGGHSNDDHQLPLQVYHCWLKQLRRNTGCRERRRLRR
jgi:hypothetical protein